MPNQGENLVRYYGWYSNVCRDKCRKAQEGTPSGAPAELTVVPVTPANREWARLINEVYEVDPLVCPDAAGGAIGIIALIQQPEAIEQILTHLDLWPVRSHSPPAAIAA